MSVDGVVLAAGLSSRAGVNKLLLELGGKTILARCLESMRPVCNRIIVVGGHRFGEIEAALANQPDIELICNDQYRDGMFSSILKGIGRVTAERFFLCPGDHPLIGKKTYADLLLENAPIVVPSFQGRSGHPVLMDSCLIPAIMNNSHKNLRAFIRANGPHRLDVSDPGIYMDVDTMADYQEMVVYFSGHRLETFPDDRRLALT